MIGHGIAWDFEGKSSNVDACRNVYIIGDTGVRPCNVFRKKGSVMIIR